MREGADVVDMTEVLRFHGHLTGWPERMRVIERRERPHPGAQLRFDDVDGYRQTAFATTLLAGSWPTWSYATAAEPGARTGSGSPKTPG